MNLTFHAYIHTFIDQLGAVFLWSYVYNLVRVFSAHSQVSGINGVSPLKQEDLTENLLPSSSSTANIKGKAKVVFCFHNEPYLISFTPKYNLKSSNVMCIR